MRGNDVPNTPVFTSYVIVPVSGDIFVYGKQSLFKEEDVQTHLNGSGKFKIKISLWRKSFVCKF